MSALECEKVERDFYWRGTEQKKFQGCHRPRFKRTLKGKHDNVNSLKLETIGLSGVYFGATENRLEIIGFILNAA